MSAVLVNAKLRLLLSIMLEGKMEEHISDLFSLAKHTNKLSESISQSFHGLGCRDPAFSFLSGVFVCSSVGNIVSSIVGSIVGNIVHSIVHSIVRSIIGRHVREPAIELVAQKATDPLKLDTFSFRIQQKLVIRLGISTCMCVG